MSPIGIDWVEEIQQLRQPGQSDAELARSLGVSKQLVSVVLKGSKDLSLRLKAKIWSHVDPERPLDGMAALAFLPSQKVSEFYEECKPDGPKPVLSPIALNDPIGELIRLRDARQMTDAELARDLGIKSSFLSLMLSGDRPVSFRVRLKVWSRMGYDFTRENVLWLFPEDAAKAIIEADIDRGRRQAQRSIAAQERRAARKAQSKKPMTSV
jgi:transcriptional regulator with XRE-family HTH domain